MFERLRERILRGDVESGEFIREHDVATALGVSRTPVRHALARLAAEGFLQRLPNRGYRVPSESIGELLELYPIITTLELLAGRLSIPHLTRADLIALRRLNRRLSGVLKSHDLREAIDANHAFHRRLSIHSGNRHLMRLLEELRAKVGRLEFWSTDQPVHAREAVLQHDAIIVAIEQGKFEQALQLLEDNRLQTYRAFRSEIDDAGAADSGESRTVDASSGVG